MKTQISEAVYFRIKDASNEIEVTHRGSVPSLVKGGSKIGLYWADWVDVDLGNDDSRSMASLTTEQLRQRYR